MYYLYYAKENPYGCGICRSISERESGFTVCARERPRISRARDRYDTRLAAKVQAWNTRRTSVQRSVSPDARSRADTGPLGSGALCESFRILVCAVRMA